MQLAKLTLSSNPDFPIWHYSLIFLFLIPNLRYRIKKFLNRSKTVFAITFIFCFFGIFGFRSRFFT